MQGRTASPKSVVVARWKRGQRAVQARICKPSILKSTSSKSTRHFCRGSRMGSCTGGVHKHAAPDTPKQERAADQSVYSGHACRRGEQPTADRLARNAGSMTTLGAKRPWKAKITGKLAAPEAASKAHSN